MYTCSFSYSRIKSTIIHYTAQFQEGYVLAFIADQTRVVHPDMVPTNYPRKYENVYRSQDNASRRQPRKSREHLEDCVVKLQSLGTPKQYQSGHKTNQIHHFSSEHTLPSVRNQRQFFHRYDVYSFHPEVWRASDRPIPPLMHYTRRRLRKEHCLQMILF